MAPSAISPERDLVAANGTALKLTTAYDDTIRFFLNGTRVVLDEIDPEVTLLEYLRGIGLTGTKLSVMHCRPSATSPVGQLTTDLLLQWLRRGRVRCLHRRHLAI